MGRIRSRSSASLAGLQTTRSKSDWEFRFWPAPLHWQGATQRQTEECAAAFRLPSDARATSLAVSFQPVRVESRLYNRETGRTVQYATLERHRTLERGLDERRHLRVNRSISMR